MRPNIHQIWNYQSISTTEMTAWIPLTLAPHPSMHVSRLTTGFTINPDWLIAELIASRQPNVETIKYLVTYACLFNVRKAGRKRCCVRILTFYYCAVELCYAVMCVLLLFFGYCKTSERYMKTKMLNENLKCYTFNRHRDILSIHIYTNI